MKHIVFFIAILVFFKTQAQQINPVPDYVFKNQMSVGRNAVTDTAAYFSIGPRYGATKGMMPPMVVDTLTVTGTKRNGLTIFSVQRNKYMYWDSVRVRWSDFAGSSGAYIFASDTSAMLSPYIRHAGNGLTKTGQALAVDTFTIATRNRAQKQVDSLGGIMVNTTTGQNISGNKIFANDITFNAQAITKLLTLPNKDGLNGYSYVRSKSTGVNNRDIYFPNDSGTVVLDKTIGSYISSNISGTTNYIPKFTASSTIGNSQIFDDGTNLGIGTTSPNQKITIQSGSGVAAAMTFRANALTSSDEFFLGQGTAGSTFLYNRGAYDMSIGTNNSTRVIVKSDGNIGIGTTTPSSLLEVSSTSPRIRVVGTTGGSVNQYVTDGGQMFVGIDNSTASLFGNGAYSRVVYGGGAYPLDFYTNDAIRARIKSDGEVLLNTTTDAGAYALQVAGSIYNTGAVDLAATSGSLRIGTTTTNQIFGTSPILQVAGDAGFATFQRFQNNTFGSVVGFTKSRNTTIGSHTIVQSGDDLGRVGYFGSDGSAFQPAAAIDGAVDGTPGANDMPGRLTFFTSADGTTTLTERMRITSTGNVGIGTTSPSGILDISKSTSGGDVRVYMRNTATTASSTFTLDLSEDGLLRSGIQYSPNTGETKFGNITTGSYAVTFYAGAAERIRLHNNGGLKFVGQSAAPTAEAGTVYYDTDDNKLKVYNGTTWVDLH